MVCSPITVLPSLLCWENSMHKRRFLSLILIVCISVSLFASVHLTRENGALALYFLDLEVSPEAVDKSGDSTILISPEGKVMLLDSGHPESAHLVIDALEALDVKTIDIFVASHPHIDHIGGFPQVAARFAVKQVYRSSLEYGTNVNQAALQAMEQYNLPVTILSEGDSFMFGDYVKVDIYNPPKEITYPKNYPDNSTQFINNQSLAMKLTYGESTAWFSGDLYMAQERTLITKYGELLQADVAKANHHGGDTSNSLRWIKNLNARIVVAMHDQLDSMTVYNNYKRYGAEYHLTLNDGLIKVVMDDKKNYQVFDTKDSWMN